MIIKIKLEPQSLKTLSPLKKISYFSIDNDATIIDLKMKIEQYVDLPAERQEIRTLEKVFENNQHIEEVCDFRGTAIMLYACDEHNEFGESHFVCFLQIYDNELAAQQQEFEQHSTLNVINNKNKTFSDSTSSVTLIANSDTDNYSEEIESETFSTSDTESGSSSDNSQPVIKKKRSKLEKNFTLQNKKLKVTSSETQYPEPLYQFLDEFPKCSKQIISTENNNQPAVKQDTYECPNKKSLSNGSIPLGKLNEDELNTKKNSQIFDIELASTDLFKVQSNKVTTTIDKGISVHPCYAINPEIRDYLAIIYSSDGNIISKFDIENLLSWFFNRFREYESSNNLQFDYKTAISLYDGKVWIACENLSTFDWIYASIAKYSLKSYNILKLKDYIHKCEVVVPVVSGTKNILDIFDLLEKQNKNIETFTWSVQSRSLLYADDKDFDEKAISTFCTNEFLSISMDTESKKNLENLDFKLKYCFWQIVFKFI